MESTLVNEETIATLKGLAEPGDTSFLTELLADFEETSLAKIFLIDTAIKNNLATDLKNAAHALKGVSLNLGAIHLADLCLRLEAMGKAGDLTNAQTTAHELEPVRTQTLLALKKSFCLG